MVAETSLRNTRKYCVTASTAECPTFQCLHGEDWRHMADGCRDKLVQHTSVLCDCIHCRMPNIPVSSQREAPSLAAQWIQQYSMLPSPPDIHFQTERGRQGSDTKHPASQCPTFPPHNVAALRSVWEEFRDSNTKHPVSLHPREYHCILESITAP